MATVPSAAQTAHFSYAQIALGGSWQSPAATVVDGSGNVYVADAVSNSVMEIQAVNGALPATPTVQTLAGSFSNPAALALDTNGNLYVADTGNGAIKEIVASSPGVFPSAPAVVTLASGLSSPSGVAVDVSGNVFFSQAGAGNAAVEEIAPTSAGVFPASPTITAVATSVNWKKPAGLAVDLKGNVYVADSQSGTVTEILKAGGYTTVQAVVGGFTSPAGVAVDLGGNVFVADPGAASVSEIQAVNGAIPASPAIVTLGGGWSKPAGVSVDTFGNLFVADPPAANPIQEVMFSRVSFGAVQAGSKSATVSLTFAFTGSVTIQAPAVLSMGASELDFANAGSGSCTGSSTWTATSTCSVQATFGPSLPGAQNGAVELIDNQGHLLATVLVSGVGIGPVAGFAPAITANLAITGLGALGLNQPGLPAFDGKGNLYVPDSGNNRVVKLAAPLSGNVAATVVVSGVPNPSAVAMDGAGNLYIAAGGGLVMKYTPAGALSTLDNGELSYANAGVAVDAQGNVYTTDAVNNRIVWFPNGGPARVFYSDGPLNAPYGLAVDSQGILYVANAGDGNVVRISQGVGTILSETYSDGGSEVSFASPKGIALDNVGNIYVADEGNAQVAMIPAGSGNATALNIGPNAPSLLVGAAVDGNGNLAVVDGAAGAILIDSLEAAPALAFPNTASGATSANQTVQLMNLGNSPLTFAVPASGNNPSLTGSFTLASTSCPSVSAGGTAQSLGAGGNCSFALGFQPTAIGVASGSLALTDNASSGVTQTISLSGTSTAASVSVTPAAGTLTDGSVGSSFSQQFKATGGTAPYTYTMTVVSGSLPAGIAFNSATGLLSGTPTSAGTVGFTVTATDSSTATSGGPFSSAAQAYSLTVSNAGVSVTPASLAKGTAGASYAGVSFAAGGGTAPYTFAITSGALPAGMALTNGALAGTPTAAGIFYFTVTATDAATKTGNRDYALTIAPPAINLSPANGQLSDGVAETAYSLQFTANGGVQPYTFTLAGGALPSGMTLSSTGLLGGLPSTAGTFNFTVRVSDSTTGSSAPYSLSQSYSVTLYPPVISVIPMQGLLAPTTVGQTNYGLSFTAKGGNGSYSYAITGGALPPGMSLVNGALIGAPTATGNYHFIVTATDSNQFSGSKNYSLAIGPPTIAIAPANAVLSEAWAESAYTSVTFSASSTNGGTAPYHFAITAGALPGGMAFDANGLLHGAPAASGTFYFTVTATDANAQTGSREFVLTVAPPAIALAPQSILDAAVGLAYSQPLTASGGSGSYVFTASGLPSWLTLDSNGLLHGTPATGDIGAAEFTVTATDAGGFSGSWTYTPSVYALAVTASGAQDLGSANIGGAAATGTVNFSFNGSFALGPTAVAVLTQGTSKPDFINASMGSCTQGSFGLTNYSCTVNVEFHPQAPGLRLGAVELLDGNAHILATRYVFGVGKGAEANFLPGAESAVSSSVPLTTPQSLLADGNGNLYVSDAGQQLVLQIKQGTATPVMTASSGLGNPQGLAMDGAGNVYIADSTNNAIWKASPPFATASVIVSNLVNAPAGGLNAPHGVAVDGAGNLYIADTGNGRILVTSPDSAGNYATPVQLPTYTTLHSPYALTVDRHGRIYIADSTANVVLVEPAGGTRSALDNQGNESKITAGVNGPTGVAIDVNGNIYIANAGAKNVLKAVNAQGGYATPASLTTVATLTSAGGVAVDASGNVFIADSTAGKIYQENYSAPPSALNFPTTTAVGSKDATDGAPGFTVLNFGNADLNFAAATGITGPAATSFNLDASTDCGVGGSALQANNTCTFAIDFKPTTASSSLTASLGLTYNNLGSSSATQSIALSGASVAAFVFNPLTGTSLPAGTIGVPYTQAIAVTNGGTSPYTYAVTNGGLPAGLTLSAGGTLAGTPTASGTFDFVVTATDSTGIDASAAYSLAIAADATNSIAQNSSTQQTVTFNFTSTAAVAEVEVLTQGLTGQDFTKDASSTCTVTTYNAAQSCTVVVDFSAKFPGTRYGAVELLDGSGDILAVSYISGLGTGPLALFSPGTVNSLSMTDMNGLGAASGLNVPGGMAVDPAGTAYVADILNDRVVKVTSGGTATVVATPGIVLHYPTGVALDGAGNLFIADNADGQVVEVTQAGKASILDNGGATVTNNFSVAVDGNGNVYTTDLGSANAGTSPRIVEYPAGGTAQAVAISGVTLTAPNGIAVDGSGNLWIADKQSIVVARSGTATALANGALSKPLSAPLAIAIDGPGNLYIADGGNARVLQLPAGAADLGSAVVLNTGVLGLPYGLAIAGAGDLYIADATQNAVVVSSQETASPLFFDTNVGVAAPDQNLTLLNAGNAALTIFAPASGINPTFASSPSDFALDTNTTCPQVAAGASSPGSLPAGSSCLYAINFTAASAGVATDTLKLTDNSNNVSNATQTVALTGTTVAVWPGSGTPSSSYTLPAGMVGTPYNNSLTTTFTAAGGAAPYCFSISGGSLPPGLALTPDGKLWGTPTLAGTFIFTVKASDQNSQPGYQVYSLTINPELLTLSPATLTAGTVYTAYRQLFTVSGGTAPYTFEVTSGTLPAGLTLSRGGELTGIPATAVTAASIVITATDSLGQTGSKTYALTINPTPVAVAPSNGSPTALPSGSALIVYSQLFTASGGTPPYAFALAINSGALPAGLTLDSQTGILSGTPTSTGTFNFTVAATDNSSGHFTGAQSYTLTIAAPVVTVTPASLPNGGLGTAYNQFLSASGGAGPYTFSVTNGSLPAGLTLAGSVLSGAPTATSATSAFTISATDTVTGAIGSRNYTLTVDAAPATASPVVFAPPQPVGEETTSPQTVTFTFHGSSIVNGIAVVTEGVPDTEFLYTHTGSCTITEYNDGDTCTLNVTFKPRYPGQRVGAAELLDADGNALGTALLSGSGIAALATVTPGTETTIVSAANPIGLQSPQGIAVDESGNAYIADSGAHAVLRVSPSGTLTGLLDLSKTSGAPSSIALDGAGNLYIADTANQAVVKLASPYTGSPAIVISNTVNPPSGGLATLGGIAVDSLGNLYFTSPGANAVYQAAQSPVTGYAAPVELPTYSTLSGPSAVAVDAAGTLYIADAGNNRVLIEPAGGSTASGQESIVSGGGINAPAAIAVDINGNISIANNGGKNILRALKSGTGYAAPAVVQTMALQSATGVALDSLGSLYLTDATAQAAIEENYSSPRLHTFPHATAVGRIDTTDGPTAYILQNLGNSTLTAVAPGVVAPTDFQLVAGSGTPQDCTAGFSLVPNATCNLSISFQPAAGGQLNEGLVLPDNSLNAGSGASQTIPLAGTGLPPLNVTWAAPAAIDYGTPLSALQLDASSGGVAGAFVYSPAAGTVLTAGAQTLSATFTPTDTINYSPVTTSVQLTVNQATPTVTLLSASNPSLYQSPLTLTATVNWTAGTPTGTVNFMDGSTSLGTASFSSGVAAFTTSSLAVGTHTITAVYSGDTNFLVASSSSIPQEIADFSVSSPDSGGNATPAVAPDGSATYSLAIASTTGLTLPVAATLSASGLPSGSSLTVGSAGWVRQSAMSWILPANTPLSSNIVLTVQLPKATAQYDEQHNKFPGGAAPLLLGVLLLPFSRRLRRAARRLSRTGASVILLIGMLVASVFLSGCSTITMTPRSYTVTVTVSAGSLTRSTNLTLNVE